MSLLDYTLVGIVGAEAAKFSAAAEEGARGIIKMLLEPPGRVLVSGGCHLGGIDIWAEEEYAALPDRAARPDPIIHLPATREWSTGYGPRNERIAQTCHEIHNIVVDRYVEGFRGRTFPICYHCARRFREHPEYGQASTHVKSGGCWTAYRAEQLGKQATWYVVIV